MQGVAYNPYSEDHLQANGQQDQEVARVQNWRERRAENGEYFRAREESA